MSRSVRLLAAFALLLIPALVRADVKDDVQAELKKFTGTWKVVSVEVNGDKIPDEKREKARLIFDGEKVTFKDFGDDKEQKTTFKVDPSKKPATIDIEAPPGEKESVQGIYKFEDGKLTICGSTTGTRPTEFKAADKKVVLLVLEKEKK
jgi:uncharacterized protein (TIGR03067 family)